MLIRENLQKLLVEKLKKLNELRPISGGMLAKLKERFEIEMTYNSNGIEGNTLTLKETYWVIQEGITVKEKPLKDHLEAKNHKEAIDFLYEIITNKDDFILSENLIREIHLLVTRNTNRHKSGEYRKVDVFISGSDHKPPSAMDVQFKMQELITWAKENYKTMDIIEFASIFHHKFVHIHPFEDGNGRTGRLLMNIFLLQYGFPITIIQKNDRKKYYTTLSSADKNNYKPLVNLVAQSALRSLNIYLDVLTPSKEKDEYITLAEASKYCSYSKEYLGKLAKEGKIDAHKEKRNWLTTKKAVEAYEKNNAK